MLQRSDARAYDQLRSINFTTDYQLHPEGSVLVTFGNTRVICAVNVVDQVPRWMREQNVRGGWLTGEYGMLPGATQDRVVRDATRGRISGRSSEIQRLIGRSLRAVLDLEAIPGKTIYVDCDVLDADGGTRCASISGAAVALELALQNMFLKGSISSWPLKAKVAAVSVGLLNGEPLLDLSYEEDVAVDVDMNVVMTSEQKFVEIQGTAEDKTFSLEQTNTMLGLAQRALNDIFAVQKAALEKYAKNE